MAAQPESHSCLLAAAVHVPGEQRESHGGRGQNGGEDQPVEHECRHDVRQDHSDRQRQESEVIRHPLERAASHSRDQVGRGKGREEQLTGGLVAACAEREPARAAGDGRVEAEQERRADAQLALRLPKLVAHRRHHAKGGEGGERDQLEGERGLLVEPVHPLRRGHGKGDQGQPAPAPVHHHRGGTGERDEHERHTRALVGGTRQHGGEQGAHQPESGDAARVPAQREPGAGGPDDHCSGQGRGQGDQFIDLARDGERHEEAGDPGGGGGQGGVGAGTPLVQPDAEHEEARGGEAAEHRPCRLVDPPAGDRQCEQEGHSEEDRRAAHPGEHLAAEQILERLALGARCGGGRVRASRGLKARRRRYRARHDSSGGGRRGRVEAALEHPDAVLKSVESGFSGHCRVSSC